MKTIMTLPWKVEGEDTILVYDYKTQEVFILNDIKDAKDHYLQLDETTKEIADSFVLYHKGVKDDTMDYAIENLYMLFTCAYNAIEAVRKEEDVYIIYNDSINECFCTKEKPLSGNEAGYELIGILPFVSAQDFIFDYNKDLERRGFMSVHEHFKLHSECYNIIQELKNKQI